MTLCVHCGKCFTIMGSLNRHIRNVHKIENRRCKIESNRRACDQCSRTFSSRATLRRHQVTSHKVKRKEKRELLLNNPKTPKQARASGDITDQIIDELPDNFDYKCRYPRSSQRRWIVVEFPVSSVHEVQQWKLSYEEKHKLFFRKSCVWKSINKSILYKVKYCCGRNMKLWKKCETARSRGKHTNCPFYFLITVLEKDDSSLLAKVRISGPHNHDVRNADSVKFRPVSDKVKAKMLHLFSLGYTPARALRTHADDLRAEYGDEFSKIQSDRFYYPNYHWVYHLYSAVFKKEFGAQYQIEMLETLPEKVIRTNEKPVEVIQQTTQVAGDIANEETRNEWEFVEEFNVFSAEEVFGNSYENLNQESLTEHHRVLAEWKDVSNDLVANIIQNPSLTAALKIMILSYRQIKTVSELQSALLCFGKYNAGLE